MQGWDASLLSRPSSSVALTSQVRSYSSGSTDEQSNTSFRRRPERSGSVYSACTTLDIQPKTGGGHFTNEAVECLDELLTCCADEWKSDDKMWELEQDEGRMMWSGRFARRHPSLQASRNEELEQVMQEKEEAAQLKANATRGRKTAERKLRQLLAARKTSPTPSIQGRGKRRKSVVLKVQGEEVSLDDLGLTLGSGLTVTHVRAGVAREGGIIPGTRIVSINGKPVSNKEDVVSILKQNNNATEVRLTIAQPEAHGYDASLPEGVFITPPKGHASCAGWYGLSRGQYVNGHHVWERCDDSNSRWYLYSTPDGRWAIASSQYDMANHLADLQTELPHGGQAPTDFNGKWLENSDGSWVRVKGVRLSAVAAPVSERVPSTTLVMSRGQDDPMKGVEIDDDMIVLSVVPGSAGERAGVLPGSRVLAIDGVQVANRDDIKKVLQQTKESDVCVTVAQPAYAERDQGVSMSLCPNKNNSDAYALLESSSALRDYGDKLVTEWHAKKCSVLEELAQNLVVPPGKDPARAVAEAAFNLHRTKGAAYPDKNLVELLVMAIYTMAGPDIDALMGFEEVPVFQGEMPEEWIAYSEKHKKDRNGAVFSAINWAGRTASDPNSENKEEAWKTLKKWSKYLGLLTALACEERGGDGLAVYERLDEKGKGWITRGEIRQHMKKYPAVRSRIGTSSVDWDEGPAKGKITKDEFLELWKKADPSANTSLMVARGIAGLPDPVLHAHTEMNVGSTISWPSPASCAFDRAVSEAYIRGEAINAVKSRGGSILFLIENSNWGLPLQAISQYPKEAELLLPPLTTFEIKRIKEGTDYGLEGVLIMHLKCQSALGASSLLSFTNECREDATTASAEIAHILAGGPAHGSAPVPPGTPVEVRTRSSKKGARWERATVLASNNKGYLVEWPEYNSDGGVKQALVDPADVRVLPVSSKLKTILLEGSYVDDVSSRYIKKEMSFDRTVLNEVEFIGTVVDKVLPSSNAAHAGLVPGSKFLQIGDCAVDDKEGMVDALATSLHPVSTTLLVPAAVARIEQLEAELNALPMVSKSIHLNEGAGVTLVGSMVVSVEKGSEAERAGLCAGCRIVSVDGSGLIDFKRQLSTASSVEILYPEARHLAEQAVRDVEQLIPQVQQSSVPSVKRAVELPGSSDAGIVLVGNVVSSVVTGGAGDKAGLRQGDKVVSVNGAEIASQGQLEEALLSGEAAQLVVMSGPRGDDLATLEGLKLTSDEHTAVLTREDEGFGLGLYGVAVVEVHPQSPASKAGVPVGCLVTSVDGTEVLTSDEVVDALSKVKRSCSVGLLVPRGYEQNEEVELMPHQTVSLEPGNSAEGIGLTLRGTTIMSVTPGSSAEKAGLAKGAVLTEVNGTPIIDEQQAAAILAKALNGNTCEIVAHVPKRKEDEALLAAQMEVTMLKDKHAREHVKQLQDYGKLKQDYTDVCEELAVLRARPSESQSKKFFLQELEEKDKERDAAKRDSKRLHARVQSLETQLQAARSQVAPAKKEDPEISAIISNLKEELKTVQQERDSVVQAAKQKSMSVENEMLRKMWTEVKAMHAALNSMLEAQADTPTQPQDMSGMRQEVDQLRHRMKQARNSTPPPRHSTPPARGSVGPKEKQDRQERQRAATFARFGLALSEALRTASGTIEYSGVRAVDVRAPAYPALRQGDMITHVNGVMVSCLEDFRREIEHAVPGTGVVFTARRWQDGMVVHESVRVHATVTKKVPGSPGGMNIVQLSERDGCNVVNTEKRTRSDSGGRRRRRQSAQGYVDDPVRIFRGCSPGSSPTRRERDVDREREREREREVVRSPSPRGRRTGSPPQGYMTPTEYLRRATEQLNDLDSQPLPSSPSPEADRAQGFVSHYSQWGHVSEGGTP